MNTILLFGAGKSATVLIDYLLTEAVTGNWKIIIADSDEILAEEKLKNSAEGISVSFDVRDEHKRAHYILQSDIVISLLPPSLHFLVAKDCLLYKKHLLTASYIDSEIEKLRTEVKENDLLFLCEMGLDPGIDHMSAKKLVDDIHTKGGIIRSFISHCGALVAPESSDNPWQYKISWNPHNVVCAGKGGASFKQNGQIETYAYEQIFEEKRYVTVLDEIYCWYPNCDSLVYMDLYNLKECSTFLRTTLRHPDFMYGWKNLVELKFTNENIFYETDGMTLMDFFKTHMDRNNFTNWLEQKLQDQFKETQGLLQNLVNLVEQKDIKLSKTDAEDEDLMMVNEKGLLEEVDMDDLKNNAAASIAFKMHESKLTLRQLFFLGMDDDKTIINKGKCSAADILQFAIQKKLALKDEDKDMVVMLHQIEYELNGIHQKIESSLMAMGKINQHTAMAKTVGLPLGIAAKLILNGTIKTRGLHIPIAKEIYAPILTELEQHGIIFEEQNQLL